ncbi:MAG: YbgF trimerization domain-containing protein, partial [Xanthobacteraceae bacterium]
MSKAMIRSVSLLALAGMLWASAAHAQVSESDMLMRIDQLQAQVRDLTGTVEELQHRNQQLQQQLQQMQQGPGGAANTAQARPGPQYAPAPQAQQQYSPPQYPASPNQQYSAPAATAQYSPPQTYTPSSEPQYSPPPQYPPPGAPLGAPGTIAGAEAAGPPPDQTASPGRHGDAFDPSANP